MISNKLLIFFIITIIVIVLIVMNSDKLLAEHFNITNITPDMLNSSTVLPSNSDNVKFPNSDNNSVKYQNTFK